MALTGFYGSNWFGPALGLPILLSETTPYSLITGPDLHSSAEWGLTILFTLVESHPLTKRLFCAFLCPVPLWIPSQQTEAQKNPKKHSPKTPQANQTHTDTQKTQSRTTQFCPHGFILPIPCRAERLQYPLGISKVSRFFLRVSKSKFNKPYSAAQTPD